MAKLTLTDGTIFEGTTEEIFAITERFNGVKAEEALKVGDYVTVTSLGMSTGFRRSDVSLGDIGKIIEIDRSKVPYRFERQSDGFVTWFAEGKLTRATDEEVAETKSLVKKAAKESELTQKFTQAGRKPNEYRMGDIVVVTDNHCAGGVSVGDIVEVGKAHADGSIFDAKHGYMLTVSPIVFVESRLDRN